MPGYLPDFNLLADMWDAGNTPNGGPPDHVNVACQKYVASKGLIDVTPGDAAGWIPPVYLRFPAAAFLDCVGIGIAECPVGSGIYYKARWKEWVHQGFPNEYFVVLVEQVDGDGNPTFAYFSI